MRNTDLNKNKFQKLIHFYFYSPARKSIEPLLPIIRSDNDIEQLLAQAPAHINTILDMFVASKLSVHALRGVEPNLRYGIAIRNFMENINNMSDIPQCSSGFSEAASININSRRGDTEAQNAENGLDTINNSFSKRKCIHLASRKQIGDAIIRYEDKSIINK